MSNVNVSAPGTTVTLQSALQQAKKARNRLAPFVWYTAAVGNGLMGLSVLALAVVAFAWLLVDCLAGVVSPHLDLLVLCVAFAAGNGALRQVSFARRILRVHSRAISMPIASRLAEDFRDLRGSLLCYPINLQAEEVKLELPNGALYEMLHGRFGDYSFNQVACALEALETAVSREVDLDIAASDARVLACPSSI